MLQNVMVNISTVVPRTTLIFWTIKISVLQKECIVINYIGPGLKSFSTET